MTLPQLLVARRRPLSRILEILAALSTGKYDEALKKGLKVAMSNNANRWEYKFEATREIAMVRFPSEANLYEALTTPLKLEASMSLGVFFNAALKVTTDPTQLLPTAGAFFKFHGGLRVTINVTVPFTSCPFYFTYAQLAMPGAPNKKPPAFAEGFVRFAKQILIG